MCLPSASGADTSALVQGSGPFPFPLLHFPFSPFSSFPSIFFPLPSLWASAASRGKDAELLVLTLFCDTALPASLHACPVCSEKNWTHPSLGPPWSLRACAVWLGAL